MRVRNKFQKHYYLMHFSKGGAKNAFGALVDFEINLIARRLSCVPKSGNCDWCVRIITYGTVVC